jgi:hypothetical protein
MNYWGVAEVKQAQSQVMYISLSVLFLPVYNGDYVILVGLF